jgi:hypothetical protein
MLSTQPTLSSCVSASNCRFSKSHSLAFDIAASDGVCSTFSGQSVSGRKAQTSRCRSLFNGLTTELEQSFI